MIKARNVDASVRQQLLTLSKARGEDFQLLLTRYAIERLLYRLSTSLHCDRFVRNAFGTHRRFSCGRDEAAPVARLHQQNQPSEELAAKRR